MKFSGKAFLYSAWGWEISCSLIALLISVSPVYIMIMHENLEIFDSSSLAYFFPIIILEGLTLLKIPLYFFIVKTRNFLTKVISLIILLIFIFVDAESLIVGIENNNLYSNSFTLSNLLKDKRVLFMIYMLSISFIISCMPIYLSYKHYKKNKNQFIS